MESILRMQSNARAHKTMFMSHRIRKLSLFRAQLKAIRVHRETVKMFHFPHIVSVHNVVTSGTVFMSQHTPIVHNACADMYHQHHRYS